MQHKRLLLIVFGVCLLIYLTCSHNKENFTDSAIKGTITQLVSMPFVANNKLISIADINKHKNKKLQFEVTNKFGETYPTNPTFIGYIQNNVGDKGCSKAENCGMYSLVLSKRSSSFSPLNYEIIDNELKFNPEIKIDKGQFYMTNKNNATVCLLGYTTDDSFMKEDSKVYLSKIGPVYVIYFKKRGKRYFLSECFPKCKADGNVRRICLTNDLKKAIMVNVYASN